MDKQHAIGWNDTVYNIGLLVRYHHETNPVTKKEYVVLDFGTNGSSALECEDIDSVSILMAQLDNCFKFASKDEIFNGGNKHYEYKHGGHE